MSDSDELRFSELRGKRGPSPPPRPQEETTFNTREFSSVRALPSPPPPPPEIDDSQEDGGFKLPVDHWRIAMALQRRWRWLVAAACVGGALGFYGGIQKVPYKVNVAFIMNPVTPAFESGMVGITYKPQQLAVGTLADLTTSPELFHRVAIKAQPPLSERALKKSVASKADIKSELVTLTIAASTPQSLMALVTNYVAEVLQMGRELQISGTSNMNAFYKERMKETQAKLTKANEELVTFQNDSGMVNPETEAEIYSKELGNLQSESVAAQVQLDLDKAEIEARTSGGPAESRRRQLTEAESELAQMRISLKEEHPSVVRQRKLIEELRSQLDTAGTNRASNFSGMSGPDQKRMEELKIETTRLRTKLEVLETQKQKLLEKKTGISTNGITYARLKAEVDAQKNLLEGMRDRQGHAQLFQDNAPGYYKLFGMEEIDIKGRWKGVIKFGMIGFFLGVLGLGAVVAGFEVLDDSLKTTVDVERVTGLPILATLGDLDAMSPDEKDGWAFRTWTALSGQLSPSPNHGMVCGFISSLPGEGRSTWINLLVTAAGQRGFRILTVATRPPRSDPETGTPTIRETEREFGEAVSRALAATKTEAPEQVATLTPQALVFPAEVSRQLTGPNAPPVAHIPLPGWVWNLERRKQWQSALAHWRAIDNLVLLVELPPASVPESVLLAENLPQLIWLVDSGKPRTRATREQLETLRYAKCRLVGAVLNHEPKPVFKL